VSPTGIKWIALIGILLIVLLGLASLYGRYRWQAGTDKLRTKLASGRRTIKHRIYNPKELEGLPAPVQRFFQTLLKEGQPIVAAVEFVHKGQFNMSETEANGVRLPPPNLSLRSVQA
jgi:hypothetical protein